MKHSFLIKLSLPVCFLFTLHENIHADTNVYQQLVATTPKSMTGKSNAAGRKPVKARQSSNKSKPQKIKNRLPAKPSPFPKAGKVKSQLQYSLVETTGNQLSVDGFSLLPVFVAGNIESQDIVRTGHRVDFFASRSLPNNSQISINIPYRQESEELTNDEGQTTTQTRKKTKGVGDIKLTYSQQLFKNNHKLPNLTGDITWKTTTGKDVYESSEKLGLGTGFQSIRMGMRATKQDDPAFLYGGIGYTLNIKDKKNTIGTINPGNIYDLSLGVAYSLTDSLSMNFGLEQAWASTTTINNKKVVNSDKHTAALAVGASLKISPKRFVSIRTKIGLNDATPGFQMQVAIPLKI